MTPIARNLLYFLGSVMAAKVVGALASFMIPKLLSPADYGVWVTLTLIVSYSSILLLGSLETLVKSFPYYQGRKEPEKALEIERAVLGSVIISVFFILLCIVAVPLVWVPAHGAVAGVQVGLMMVNAVCNLYASFYYYRFTAHQDFRRVSIVDTLRSVASFALLVFFSWRWGLTGTVIGSLINETFIMAITLRMNRRSLGALRPVMAPRLLWQVVRIGFPITIIWWVFILQTSVDRVLAMAMLGKAATGYYGLGVSIVSVMILVPMALGRVLYPRINEEIGNSAGEAKLAVYVVAPAQALSLILPLLIAALVFLAPFIYSVLFPKYRPGMVSAQVLVVGTFFVCLIRSGVNYLVAVNRQNRVFFYVLASLAVTVALGFFFVKLGFGIAGIAAAAGAAGFLLSTLTWQATFSTLGRTRAAQACEIAALYAPFGFIGLLIGLCRFAVPEILTTSGVRPLVTGGLVCVAYAALIALLPATRGRAAHLARIGLESVRSRRSRVSEASAGI